MENTLTNSLNEWDDETEVQDTIKTCIQEDTLTNIINEDVEQKVVPKKSFDEMGLKDEILRGIYTEGYTNPAQCQESLPLIIDGSGRDVILSASAGSGKTLVIAVAALQHIDLTIKNVQSIIVSPTREIALQTFNVITKLAAYTGISIALHRGVGVKTREVVENTNGIKKSESYISYGKATEGKEQIIVATPGRLLDILTNEKGIRIANKMISKIDASFVGQFIMDEADELLSVHNGFQDMIIKIFSNINTIDYCQKMIISATITPNILDICQDILKHPLQILVKKENLLLSSIKHYRVVLTEEEHKIECLLDIYKNVSIGTSIIFANNQDKVKWIYSRMLEEKFSVAYIHGQMQQSERDETIKKFRSGGYRVLVTTDLLSRGIDIQTVSLVVNYDLPNSKETYTHRTGRAGRYGKHGTAITFVIEVSGTKSQDIRELERYYNIQINELPPLENMINL